MSKWFFLMKSIQYLETVCLNFVALTQTRIQGLGMLAGNTENHETKKMYVYVYIYIYNI